jgi:ATP/ADP translocase
MRRQLRAAYDLFPDTAGEIGSMACALLRFELGCRASGVVGDRMGSTIKAIFYTVLFGLAAYAVVVDDRTMTKILLPVVFLVIGWWIWKDLKVTLERRQREREAHSKIINQRLNHLEDRLDELENRVDGL